MLKSRAEVGVLNSLAEVGVGMRNLADEASALVREGISRVVATVEELVSRLPRAKSPRVKDRSRVMEELFVDSPDFELMCRRDKDSLLRDMNFEPVGKTRPQALSLSLSFCCSVSAALSLFLSLCFSFSVFLWR